MKGYIIKDYQGNPTFYRESKEEHDKVIESLSNLGYTVIQYTDNHAKVKNMYQREILKAYLAGGY